MLEKPDKTCLSVSLQSLLSVSTFENALIKVNTAVPEHGLQARFPLGCLLTFKMDVLAKSGE